MSSVLVMADIIHTHGTGPASVNALRGVSLTVRAGELVAVMGPSGAGKSSLLMIAGGLERATRGSVRVDGIELGSATTKAVAAVRRRVIGYVFQDYNLIPALTILENVALPLELDGTRRAPARKLALAALADLGLANLAPRFPDEVSGGQAQRVAIARAVVGDRRLILADEPTGALDTATGDAVLQMLRARADAGAAGVLVTHDARHAAWADRVVFLRDGRIVDDTGHAMAAESMLGGALS